MDYFDMQEVTETAFHDQVTITKTRTSKGFECMTIKVREHQIRLTNENQSETVTGWGDKMHETAIALSGMIRKIVDADFTDPAAAQFDTENELAPGQIPMIKEKPDGYCKICGEPMPSGEEMFKFHGYSGPCPKPAQAKPEQPKTRTDTDDLVKRTGPK